MGCNCGKNRRPLGPARPESPPAEPTPPSYQLTTTDGRVLTYQSSLEAKAAQTRFGGSIKAL